MTGVLEAIKAAIPSAGVEFLKNPSPCAQHSLLVAANDALAVAGFLRDSLGFDFCSNVSGVDWPARKVKEEIVHKETVEGVETEVKKTVEREIPGFLEVVYHLFSDRQ